MWITTCGGIHPNQNPTGGGEYQKSVLFGQPQPLIFEMTSSLFPGIFPGLWQAVEPPATNQKEIQFSERFFILVLMNERSLP
jgi:hypothetical protein